MSSSPNRFRPTVALSAAEAVFKPEPQPTAAPVVAEKRLGVPISKEQVSLKLDSDLIAHFQEDGPGWQERINDALRRRWVCERVWKREEASLHRSSNGVG